MRRCWRDAPARRATSREPDGVRASGGERHFSSELSCVIGKMVCDSRTGRLAWVACRTTRHHGAFDLERIAAALEVEGELTAGLTSEAIALCADRFAAAGDTVRRVVDLGCGPGVGTALLAERFPSATVVAVDGSAAMLARAGARAASSVSPIASRRARWTWTATISRRWGRSTSPGRRWRSTTPSTRSPRSRTSGSCSLPHGLVCVLEREDATVVRLADDLGRPGIWDRLHAARPESARPVAAGRVERRALPRDARRRGARCRRLRTR